jgi:hypothetical protein
MSRSLNRLVRGFLACLLLTLCHVPVFADLSGLVFDESDGSLMMASIDPATGAVSPGAAALSNCCQLVTGLTAIDQAGERLFAIGLQSGDQTPLLLTFALDGSAASSIELDQLPQALLAYDSGAGRLISVILGAPPSASSQWISIEPTTGAVTQIGSPDASCCEILTGLAAVASGPQQLYLLGRDFGEPDWQLLGIDLATGASSALAELPAGHPGFLSLDADSGQVDLLIQTAPQASSGLYRVNPVDGTFALQATQIDADCCLMMPGQAANLDDSGQFWWLGGSGSGLTPSSGFFAIRATLDGASLNRRQLSSGYRLNALVLDGEIVFVDQVFQDRFEL